MSENSQSLIYQKISRICGVAIPVLYFLAALSCIALIVIIFVIMFGSGPLEINKSVNLDLDTLSMGSRLIFVIGLSGVFFFLFRFFWFLLNVAKRFKLSDVFSENTAKHAHSAAFNLMCLHIFLLGIGAYGALITGDIKISLPEGVISIMFAYLFAWVLKIGSQLKTENDLTV